MILPPLPKGRGAGETGLPVTLSLALPLEREGDEMRRFGLPCFNSSQWFAEELE